MISLSRVWKELLFHAKPHTVTNTEHWHPVWLVHTDSILEYSAHSQSPTTWHKYYFWAHRVIPCSLISLERQDGPKWTSEEIRNQEILEVSNWKIFNIPMVHKKIGLWTLWIQIIKFWCYSITLVLWIVFQSGRPNYLIWKYGYHSLLHHAFSVMHSHTHRYTSISLLYFQSGRHFYKGDHSPSRQKSLCIIKLVMSQTLVHYLPSQYILQNGHMALKIPILHPGYGQ